MANAKPSRPGAPPASEDEYVPDQLGAEQAPSSVPALVPASKGPYKTRSGATRLDH